MKFPSEQLTRWGLMILIGVQLYLLVYLKQFSSQLKADDPGWDVPWIAMGQSLLARCMLFVSITLLPVCSAFVILIQAISQASSNGWGSEDRVSLTLMGCGIASSVLLAILSWTYRPKLKKQVAPAQLFE